MLVLSNDTQLVEFTRIMLYNLNNGRKSSEVVFSLNMKSDYGNALEQFLINASIQLKKNALDNIFVFRLVQDFFESFASSESWLDRIDLNIKIELKKQNKTTKQTKVG